MEIFDIVIYSVMTVFFIVGFYIRLKTPTIKNPTPEQIQNEQALAGAATAMSQMNAVMMSSSSSFHGG